MAARRRARASVGEERGLLRTAINAARYSRKQFMQGECNDALRHAALAAGSARIAFRLARSHGATRAAERALRLTDRFSDQFEAVLVSCSRTKREFERR